MTEPIDLQEFVGAFTVEADELLATANAATRDIEAGLEEHLPRPRAVRELFRALHTIKGLASMVGVEAIVDIAHAAETMVRAADRAGGRFRANQLEASVQALTAISERVHALAAGRTPPPAPEALLETIAALDAEHAGPAPSISDAWDARLTASERHHVGQVMRSGRSVWSLTFVPSDDKVARGVTIATVREALGRLGEIAKISPRTQGGKIAFDILIASDSPPDAIVAAASADSIDPVTAPVEEPAPIEAPPPLAMQHSVVRVDLTRLDTVQEHLSQLTVSRFRLEREIATLAAAGTNVRALREIADVQTRQLKELRRAVLRARLVRVGEMLEPLTLLVRGAMRPGHKEVKLVLDARDAELDKAVADRLLPAIVHLVRNAIDHAIESPPAREAAGKPRAGTIRIVCGEVAGTELDVVVADDGAGIDRDSIARRARRPIEDDSALLDVLTTPGFSTRDVVTQTSGRGVGMDIVKRIVVADLGGEMSVSTEPGRGTRFALRVPLTLAMVDVFSLACGDETFVVPVATVEEIIELGDRVKPASPRSAGVSLLERRGRAIPLISLGELLACGDGHAASKVVIVRRRTELVGFAVDRMLGRHEVLVKPIDDPLVRAAGVSGATDLGTGRPTLVLDLVELGDHVDRSLA